MAATLITQQQYLEGRARRHGRIVCERITVHRIDDRRIGLAPTERRHVSVRFLDGLEPGFRTELVTLVQRRGAAARRAAEGLEPLELVLDMTDGRQCVAGRLEPPLLRSGALRNIEFGIGLWP